MSDLWPSMICLSLAVGFWAADARAEPNKVEYELAERCGKSAAAWFKQEYRISGGGGVVNTNDGQATVGYENHYNRKQNKCFVLESYQSVPSKKDRRPALQLTLFDFNDTKEIGYFFAFIDTTTYRQQPPMECRVRDLRCHSEDEWRALAKPFMEE